MAVNKSTYGLQKDGSVQCHEDDYCLQFMRNYTWDKTVQRTPADFPWITPDEFKESYTYKYLNYQMEEGYINPDDPLHTGESIKDLRKGETRSQSLASKRKKTAAAAEQEFSTIAQGVKEVKDGKGDDEVEDEVFVDEFGNVIDNDQDLDSDLAAKAMALMDTSPTNKSPSKSKESKNEMFAPPNNYGYAKKTWKDLDDVRDVHVSQEKGPRKPMFKSQYIEPKDSVLTHFDQKQYLKLMQMFPIVLQTKQGS